jgi:hypothetical protein
MKETSRKYDSDSFRGLVWSGLASAPTRGWRLGWGSSCLAGCEWKRECEHECSALSLFSCVSVEIRVACKAEFCACSDVVLAPGRAAVSSIQKKTSTHGKSDDFMRRYRDIECHHSIYST